MNERETSRLPAGDKQNMGRNKNLSGRREGGGTSTTELVRRGNISISFSTKVDSDYKIKRVRL
eukprot:11202355-Lingulodinium_polyedra.AAC.1